MSELSIFLLGVLVFFMCGCAALGPFLYSAWRAEKNWLRRKQKNSALSRPDSRTIAKSVPVQVHTRHIS
jgi:hypothetical protein